MSDEYEYRILVSYKTGLRGEGPWSDWRTYYGQAQKTVFTRAGVKRILSNLHRTIYGGKDIQTRVQRRPVRTDWEDVDI